MRVRRTLILVAFLSLAAGCVATRFGPGFSMNDKNYFMEPPYIAATPDGYNLRWRYGTTGFFFTPSSKVADGRLLFALQQTSSSAHLTGLYGELPIKGEKRIHALQTGGAYWVEPDGQQVRLEVKRVLTAPKAN